MYLVLSAVAVSFKKGVETSPKRIVWDAKAGDSNLMRPKPMFPTA